MLVSALIVLFLELIIYSTLASYMNYVQFFPRVF